MRIHTDNNGVYVNAISQLGTGEDVEGYLYNIQAGLQFTKLEFQKGGVAANGVNGITNETLLAVLIHRIQYLDNLFPCEENKAALDGMKAALASLESRTAKRVARGVEGQEVV